MSRTYSDPSYGSKKIFPLLGTGSVVGTHASGTVLAATEVSVPLAMTIKDWSLQSTVAGTHSAKSLILNTKLGGTGALVPVGTAALGTHAIFDTTAGSATSTKVVAGDSIVVSMVGTDAIVSEFLPKVTYVETYVQSDN